MPISTRLADYLAQVVAHCQYQLNQWYVLPESLSLDGLALTALHFLHTAIDRNEVAGAARQDYLLVLPDAELPETLLQSALLGALLSKYRANYIMASPTAVRYAPEDILLRIKSNGDTDLRQVTAVDATGAITKLTSFPISKGLLEPAAHRNFVKLLSVKEAKEKGFESYPRAARRLADNMRAIQGLLKDVDGFVAAFPHRLGLLCAPGVLETLQAELPLPVRDWKQGGGCTLTLPLAPLVEAARNYATLNSKAFAPVKPENLPVCDELLIFDADKYCDGNGLFDQIRDGRSWNNYRNLVLIGSRRPRADHAFCSWEWTPEELALLRDLPCRPPVVLACGAPAVRAAHEALCQTIAELATSAGINLKPLLRYAAQFYRLVLPPAHAATHQEATRQTAGLLAWVQGRIADDEPFAEAGIWGEKRGEIRDELLARFEVLAQAVAQSRAKFDAVRTACAAPAMPTWPKGKAKRGQLPPVVLVLPRREAAATEAALKAALTPGHAVRLRVVPAHRLPWAMAQAALNRPEAVWLLPTLRFGRNNANESELNLYRQLMLLRAEVRLLAYEGIEEGRAEQLAVCHGQLVEAALLHPGRAHFVGELRPVVPEQPGAPPVPPDASEALPPLTYTPQPLPDADTESGFADLDAVFGPLVESDIALTWKPVWPPAPEAARAADLPDAPEPRLDDDDYEGEEVEEPELLPKAMPVYTLRFNSGEEVTLPATARVYGRPQATDKWQPRTPPQLLGGDEVLIIESNPNAIREELARSQPEKMREIDEMASLWKQVLRRLLHDFHHGDIAALHQKLKRRGLRVREQSVASWVSSEGKTRFPEAEEDLEAIAKLEAHHRGASAQLAAQLDRVKVARRYNDRAVAGHSRSFNAQVRRFLNDNRAVPANPELAGRLRNTQPRRLHSVVLAAPNQPTFSGLYHERYLIAAAGGAAGPRLFPRFCRGYFAWSRHRPR